MGLDGTTQAGHILALLGHLDLSVAPKSGSLCIQESKGSCILILWVPARRGYRAGCESPGREELLWQWDKVPSTFPAGAMGLINKMSWQGWEGHR